MRKGIAFNMRLSVQYVIAILIVAAALPLHASAAAATSPMSRPPFAALFAGLDNGTVVSSTDGGITWRQAGAPLDDNEACVCPLALGAGGTIYAPGHGRSIDASVDGGLHWLPVTDDGIVLRKATIFGIATDPADARSIYAIDVSAGLYHTADGGRHWSARRALPVGQGFTVGNNPLLLNPQRPNTLLIAVQEGIYQSLDTGKTWRRAPSIAKSVTVYDAAFSGADPDVAYAATSDGMYQTVDGGATWLPQRRGIEAGTLLHNVAVDPLHAAHVVAVGASIYNSLDGGTSWSRTGDLAPDASADSLAFDTTHPGTILIGLDAGALLRSTDGGLTWGRASLGHGNQSGVRYLLAASRPMLPTQAVQAPPAAPNVVYVTATHHTIAGPFLAFYRRFGGLSIFGLPLTEPFVEGGARVQYFERAEMVLGHHGITVAALASRLTKRDAFPPAPVGSGSADRVLFPSTGHTLSGVFLRFWRQHHGAQVLGLPISEPFYAQNGDDTGRYYLMQYCRNTRLEYHAELAGTANVVSLGLLGQEEMQRRGWL
jgi:photosystem II stability/assembly factor-like uncharacterized protein